MSKNLARVLGEFAVTGIKWLVHKETGRLMGIPAEQVEMLSDEEREQWIETLAVMDALDVSQAVKTRNRVRN